MLPSIFNDFFRDDYLGVPVRRQFATPAVNIKETDKQYDIQVAAPGMTKDDFHLSINSDNEIVISLEKKQDNCPEKCNKEEKATWLRREFSYVSYNQNFIIPDDVEIEKKKKKMEHGVLSIYLPKKAEETKLPVSRNIDIQ